MDEQATMTMGDKGVANNAANDQTGKTGNIRHYADERIDVSYDAARCIHAAECVHGLPDVFDTGRRPWILPSGAGADAIAAVVAKCPTGALHAVRLDGGPAEVIPSENSIVPTPDGPLYVRGQLHVQTPEGDVTLDDVRVALCRCGQSRNKPFCDNSHRDAGFRDAGAITGANGLVNPSVGPGHSDSDARETPTLPQTPTPTLSIVPTTDGPLALDGAFTLRTSDGGAWHYAVKATLCRCGASNRKPFCDGSHRRIGFRSSAEAPPSAADAMTATDAVT
jgi:CDGSH-type Zn-finger protein/uncharacterized Fe-S cluster protein YjdI